MSELQDILKQIAKTETTAELRDYWLDQYKTVIDKEIVILDPNTISLFEAENIAKPITPIASINLEKLINNSIVDEVLMQQNVEVAVRMLDSSLDVFKFNSDVSSLIEQFRKIGVKLINYEKYLGDESSKNYKEKFENLGSAFSNACYRSSESLAEEKGVCLDWDNLKFQLRPKPFEYWYNMETGEIHNGLEVYEDYTPQTVRNSPFEVVPRRNSHIIILPNNPEWSIWSDREINSLEIKSENETQKELNSTHGINNIQVDEVPSSDPSLKELNNVHPETIPFEQVLPNIMDSMNQQIQSKQNIKNNSNNISLGNEILDSKVSFESNPILDNEASEDEESEVFLKSMNLDSVAPNHELMPLDLEAKPKIEELEGLEELEEIKEKQDQEQKLEEHLNSAINLQNELQNDFEPLSKNEITTDIIHNTLEFAQTKKLVNNESHINHNNHMTQYTIALQQIINLKDLGGFLINANYDADGLKMLTYQGGELSTENDKLIRSYLGLINMSLSKGLTSAEISEEITEESEEESSVVTQMVNMLGQVLKSLPGNIGQINSNSLKSLDLATVRRATKTKKNVLEA